MDLLGFYDYLSFLFTRVSSRLPDVFLTFLFGYLAVRGLQSLLHVSFRTARINKAMSDILISTTSAVLWIGLVALLFQSLGLKQIAIALSGSVAIVGLGIAAGANKLVSDVVAGLFLAKNRNFNIGQKIKMAELEGEIQSVDIRKVRVMGKDGTLYIIPNTKFDEQIWQTVPEKEQEKGK